MPRLKTLPRLCIAATLTVASGAWLAENAQAIAGSPVMEKQNGGRRVSLALARIDLRGGPQGLPGGASVILQGRTVYTATAAPSARS